MNSIAIKDSSIATENGQGYNISQLRQVFLCCEKVFSMEPAQGKISVARKKILS